MFSDSAIKTSADSSCRKLTDSEWNSVVIQELGDPHRLRLLEQLEVLDSPPERRFQLLTDLASSLLETPVALISLVTNDRQFFVSSTGLHQPWAGERQTPLSHSFCQHVVTRDKPLVVSDSESNPLVEQNLATSEIGVKAYLGYPCAYRRRHGVRLVLWNRLSTERVE